MTAPRIDFFKRALAPLAGLVAVLALAALPLFADWPMHRGNPQRTGTLDKNPYPIQKPRIFWSYKVQEQFVACLVPQKNVLFASGLGAFNTAQVHALALDDLAADGATPAFKRGAPLWSKAAPFIKLPTVSSPAVFDNMVIFGDGMHQTDGAVLYALDLTTGRPLWRYEVEGKLTHMEGAPIVDPTFPG